MRIIFVENIQSKIVAETVTSLTMQNHGHLTFILLAFLLLSSSCKEKQLPAPQTRPNIVLIVADDLGFTDLGCFGGEISTPNLDRLAFQGLRSTSFHTAPTCSPTRAMLLTGVDNHRNGYGTMEGDWAENQKGVRGYEGHLNFDVVTFPKLLQINGYHTSIAGKWHQAYPADDERLWPDKRGFDRSFSILQGGAGHFEDMQPMFSFYKKSLYVEDGKELDSLPRDFYSSDFYTQKAMEYISESVEENKPFFSYIAYTAPHWPLQVPNEYIDLYQGRYDEGYEVLAEERIEQGKKLGIIPENTPISELTPNVMPWQELNANEKAKASRTMEIYAAMVERLDANVGKIMEHLKSLNQEENTLIIFMSDNGAEGNNINNIVDTRQWVAENFDNSMENMGRQNSYIFTGPSWAQVSSTPFKWYKGFSTEGGVRTPFILSFPKWSSNAGRISNEFISVQDLAPTVLDIAGIQHPDTLFNGRKIYPMDGISLKDWLAGKRKYAHKRDTAHCWELYGRRAVLKGDWKAEFYDKPYGKGEWELYNLKQDPAQLIDLALTQTAKLVELKADWDEYAKRYNLTLPNQKVGYGEDEIWRKETN
ncbi:arylsulfatase [Flagellimonas sp.]|uniref:arylsulfatase n=1 Tax=Flagellimonas sp. TaxID=2058762 RepID=UPI003F49C9E1